MLALSVTDCDNHQREAKADGNGHLTGADRSLINGYFGWLGMHVRQQRAGYLAIERAVVSAAKISNHCFRVKRSLISPIVASATVQLKPAPSPPRPGRTRYCRQLGIAVLHPSQVGQERKYRQLA